MLYPEGLMHRKVNIWLALLAILLVAGIFAWIITARAFIPGVNFVPGIAVQINAAPVKCVLDPCPGPGCAGFCQSSCQTCGSLAGLCNGLFEIKATRLSGYQSLYNGAGGPAICTTITVPPNGGAFQPGRKCIGNIFGVGPHILKNFACSIR